MEEYPKNSVQHNLQDGLIVIAIDPCVMTASEETTLTVNKRYTVNKTYGRFNITDDNTDLHEFGSEWDKYFRLVNMEPFIPESDIFTKLDSDKNRLELLEPEFILGIGKIITFGANKYSADNWQKADAEGIERIKGALFRHWMAYLSGEKIDPETKEPHLYHIGCNLMFLDYFDRIADDGN